MLPSSPGSPRETKERERKGNKKQNKKFKNHRVLRGNCHTSLTISGGPALTLSQTADRNADSQTEKKKREKKLVATQRYSTGRQRKKKRMQRSAHTSYKLKRGPWPTGHASGWTLSSGKRGLEFGRSFRGTGRGPSHRKIIDRALIAACRAA